MRLFSRQVAIIALSLTVLCSCSLFTKHQASSDATGYLADRGAVRLWQHNSATDGTTLVSLFTPFDGSPEVRTEYHWEHGTLISITQARLKGPDNGFQIRFDAGGRVSFMQQQFTSHRERLTDDEIALAKFEAQRLLGVSQNLKAGQIILQQGRWNEGHRVETCQKEPLEYSFSDRESQQLLQLSQTGPVYVAWLDAPEGKQLLLMTAQNLCRQAPQQDENG